MVEVIVKTATKLPMKHKVAKLVIGTVAGFAAQHWAEKGYVAAYECIKKTKIAK